MVTKIEEEMVKGTWLKDWAKMMRKWIKDNPNKKGSLNTYLEPQDFEILEEKILESTKYPYAFFRRLGRAVFYLIARGDLELTRTFGKLLMRNLLETYKNLLTQNDPLASAKKLVKFHTVCFFNVESCTKVIAETSKSIIIILTLTKEDKQFAQAAQGFAWQLGGQFEELVTLAGASNVQLTITPTAEKNYQYALSWD